MDVDGFLKALRHDPAYADQIVHIHDTPARSGAYAAADVPDSPILRPLLNRLGIPRLYTHQAEALEQSAAGRDVLVATGTASGKTLCYALPIIEVLARRPESRALLLFPTKALCQDQFARFRDLLQAAGLEDRLAGVLDGDTPADLRRRLRDQASVVFSNPDMLHAGIMPTHGTWAGFLGDLSYVVLDELHVYSGIFGSNMAHVLTRFQRLCGHYGSRPRMIACSATMAAPKDLADRLTGRDFHLVEADGSPRGRRVTVLWNPPRVRERVWRSRRSANVEAHDLMAKLIAQGVPTIVFSKAKMTAEMIHRYVVEELRRTAPGAAAKVTPYRGGYLPSERREIESRLFSGELLGVSTTPALELGIDVGSIEAAILVGYPGTQASFFQQAGRAGRRDADALAILIGLDTSTNQYIMAHPEYIFDRAIEEAVIDPQNPFVLTGHLRCAVHELPLSRPEASLFGPHAETALGVLESHRKVRRLGESWYHAATEIPQHEVPLRDVAGANVLIQDAGSGVVLGEVNRFDAPPILHPEAIYMHRGDTYRVLSLDLERNLATVRREEVDYYTQPLGGTDVHHIDQRLREKPFGTGMAYWGEVTAYFRTTAYERIHFYSLDAISRHGVDLPNLVLETMAFWLVPPEGLMAAARLAGLDVHSGLRGIGYATRVLLPLFMTCDTLDFSHSVGCINAPWNAVFVYERYPHGLGFTEKAFAALHRIVPAVLALIRQCPCPEGCPCCVGKPLRQNTTWNVERGEGAIPSKEAARFILEGLLGDGQALQEPEQDALSMTGDAVRARLERAVQRRLEIMREPQVFHPITPLPRVRTAYPEREEESTLDTADAGRRAERRRGFEKDLRHRLALKLSPPGISPDAPPGNAPLAAGLHGGSVRPRGMKLAGGTLPPGAFATAASPAETKAPAPATESAATALPSTPAPVLAGDPRLGRARLKAKSHADSGAADKTPPPGGPGAPWPAAAGSRPQDGPE